MKFISSEKIPGFLEALSARSTVWAPRELTGSGGTVMFERWRPGDPIDLEHYSSLSAKDVVLPRTEKLFGYTYAFGGSPFSGGLGASGTAVAASDSDQAPATSGEQIVIKPAEPAPSTVLFGVRACDAKSIQVLDALFNNPGGEGYNDPQYSARREGLTVITLACTTCDDACFCSSFENGASEKAGSDLILYPVDGGFLAEGVTGKGGELLSEPFFEESELAPPPLAETAVIEGLERLQEILPGLFDDLDFWERVSERCVSCGFCTYGCPTCHCFNIHDEMQGDREGERLRSWDACMFALYTQETSGHNPRPTLAHRYRNRINHKFSYYPENQGEILCTGCGRCIRGCPAALDIRDVLRDALKAARKE
ncbi:MAG: 4Fe-4S dicluster domain-containing protein [Actinobacteria bacterium]|nr:4Fe-4S dicluster domain-containing protein [Actinomycetota bacterium]